MILALQGDNDITDSFFSPSICVTCRRSCDVAVAVRAIIVTFLGNKLQISSTCDKALRNVSPLLGIERTYNL